MQEGDDMHLADIGRYWAVIRPDDIGLRFEGRSFHWAELDRITDELAAGLAAAGVVAGDRVGLMMLNRPEWCFAAMATLKLDAVVVPINVRFTAAEVGFVCRDAGCRVLVSEDALRPALADVGDVTVLFADDLDRHRVEGAAPTVPDV
jgi:fatty-acyl-CoA synthase